MKQYGKNQKGNWFALFQKTEHMNEQKAIGLLVWVCELTPWKYFYTLRVEKVNDYNDLMNELWFQVYNIITLL